MPPVPRFLQVDTFERRLQFAYRLMDLDGDGSLDKFELNAVNPTPRTLNPQMATTIPEP